MTTPAAPAPIDLDPSDWLWATWRPRPARVRPEPRAFDLKECADRLARVSSKKGWGWGFDDLQLPDAMSPQEAEFWFRAVSKAPSDGKPKEFALWAARQQYTGEVTIAEIKAAVQSRVMLNADTFVNAVSRLIPLRALCELLVGKFQANSNDDPWGTSLFAFHRYVLPYLTADEIQAFSQELAPQVEAQNWPQRMDRPAAFHVASMLGMHREMLTVVERWPDDAWAATPWSVNRLMPQFVVLGLGSAELVREHTRRLKLPLHHPEYLRAWLAHTELSALDSVRDVILADQPRERRRALVDVFALVKAPEAVRPMLELKMQPDTLGPARAWFAANADIAIATLLPLVSGRTRLSEAAADTLWELKQMGHEARVTAELDKLAQIDPTLAAAARHAVFDRAAALPPLFDAATTPAWLVPASSPDKRKQLPSWLNPASLPAVIVTDRMLTPEHVDLVCHALQRSGLGTPDPFIQTLKQHAERASLDAFAWRVFELWNAEGGPAAHKWAMHALGLIGSDASAHKLAEMIRTWPSEGLTARAAIGLECLRAIGTEGALMQLDAIARKIRFKGLRERARRAMDEIAAARRISAEDLEDLVIPDCGLNSQGRRVFDLGSRKVSFALAEGMKPMLRDGSGKLHSGLPRASSGDEARKVEAGKAEWALLKKQLSQVIKVQVDRLKKALSLGRRWRLSAFLQLSGHPLMCHLIRAQLWGLYRSGEPGPEKLLAAFRVTDEGDWADAADAMVSRPAIPADNVCVGLLHPIHLTEAQRGQWGEMLGDYEIISPVPQLARSVYPLTPEELTGTDISRFTSSPSPAMLVGAILLNMGWRLDARQDAGSFQSYSKPFRHAGISAVVEIRRAPAHYEDLVFPRLFFIRSIAPPQSFADYANNLRLDKVDPAVASEAMRDIAGVISAGAREIAKR